MIIAIRLYFSNYFRQIVAGGGTGGAAVSIGEQLNHTNAEIVYIDFSTASMHTAQKRAKFRRLRNIIWIRSWIESSRYLGIGKFNELQCSGVLHHLKSPTIGLNVLKDSLYDDGKMVLMVYAKYGRTGVYQLQNMIKMVNSYTKNEVQIELKNAKKILSILPKSNWFSLSNFVFELTQHIDIYDLLLHKRDIAFSFESLFKWIYLGGLHFVELDHYVQRVLTKAKYIFHDQQLRGKMERLGIPKQFHATEIIHGMVPKHSFYSSKTNHNSADIQDSSNVLFIFGYPHGLREAIQKKMNYKSFGNQSFFQAELSSTYITPYTTTFRSQPFDVGIWKQHKIVFGYKSNAFTNFLMKRLVTSNRGVHLEGLYASFKAESLSKISKIQYSDLLKEFYESVKDTDVFYLRSIHSLPFPKTSSHILFKISSI